MMSKDVFAMLNKQASFILPLIIFLLGLSNIILALWLGSEISAEWRELIKKAEWLVFVYECLINALVHRYELIYRVLWIVTPFLWWFSHLVFTNLNFFCFVSHWHARFSPQDVCLSLLLFERIQTMEFLPVDGSFLLMRKKPDDVRLQHDVRKKHTYILYTFSFRYILLFLLKLGKLFLHIAGIMGDFFHISAGLGGYFFIIFPFQVLVRYEGVFFQSYARFTGILFKVFAGFKAGWSLNVGFPITTMTNFFVLYFWWSKKISYFYLYLVHPSSLFRRHNVLSLLLVADYFSYYMSNNYFFIFKKPMWYPFCEVYIQLKVAVLTPASLSWRWASSRLLISMFSPNTILLPKQNIGAKCPIHTSVRIPVITFSGSRLQVDALLSLRGRRPSAAVTLLSIFLCDLGVVKKVVSPMPVSLEFLSELHARSERFFQQNTIMAAARQSCSSSPCPLKFLATSLGFFSELRSILISEAPFASTLMVKLAIFRPFLDLIINNNNLYFTLSSVVVILEYVYCLIYKGVRIVSEKLNCNLYFSACIIGFAILLSESVTVEKEGSKDSFHRLELALKERCIVATRGLLIFASSAGMWLTATSGQNKISFLNSDASCVLSLLYQARLGPGKQNKNKLFIYIVKIRSGFSISKFGTTLLNYFCGISLSTNSPAFRSDAGIDKASLSLKVKEICWGFPLLSKWFVSPFVEFKRDLVAKLVFPLAPSPWKYFGLINWMVKQALLSPIYKESIIVCGKCNINLLFNTCIIFYTNILSHQLFFCLEGMNCIILLLRARMSKSCGSSTVGKNSSNGASNRFPLKEIFIVAACGRENFASLGGMWRTTTSGLYVWFTG